ncbi:MAG: RNA polymerase sigma factor [Opitutaceae bacterium]
MPHPTRTAPTVSLPDPNPPSATGDQSQWFIEEVQPHRSALQGWLRSRFPWLLDVDDLVQEAMLRLWRRKTKPESAPLHSGKAALFAIARNAATDIARRRAVIEMDSVADMERLSVLDSADVVETVSARQELEILAAAVRDLPARCRQVLTLTKIYGYSEREVAARLGISEHTVRTQVVRGMERCAEYLRRRGVDRTRA